MCVVVDLIGLFIYLFIYLFYFILFYFVLFYFILFYFIFLFIYLFLPLSGGAVDVLVKYTPKTPLKHAEALMNHAHFGVVWVVKRWHSPW